jgi:hypothetical protein
VTPRRALIAFATFWPLFYVLVFLVFPPTRQFFAANGWRLPHGNSVTLTSLAAMGLHGLSLLCVGGASLYDVLHLSRAKHVPESEKLPWTILLMAAGILAAPAYWFFYVRREPKAPEPLSPRP